MVLTGDHYQMKLLADPGRNGRAKKGSLGEGRRGWFGLSAPIFLIG